MRRDDIHVDLQELEVAHLGTAVPPMPACLVELGQTAWGPTMLDLGRLLSTRLLIQAGSGGGKSWLMRRVLEQSHGKVRQIVFDPEGELVTLAEKFDFTVCAPDSEFAPIGPETGAEAARAIFLSRRSAILNLSEFDGLEEMQLFVADFCKQLLRMPPETWHHVLIAIDEAQLFAPQHDKAVSKKPLIDLARRGRKRGMCPVVATQRLSELAKGVAAMLENRAIGLTTLDLDIARAADMLGMRVPAARAALRDLQGGHFIAFGPALGYDLVETKVGPIMTAHGLLAPFSGIAAEPSLSNEDLAAQLRGFLRPKPRAPDVDGPCDAGEVCAACGRRQEAATAVEKASQRLSPQERLERAFTVLKSVLEGVELADLAAVFDVTDHAVRCWLHEALCHFNLPRLGIRGQRVRVSALREHAEAILAKLASARSSAERDLRRQARNAH